ncbi:MAG: ACT domain-containing protein [Verrucomicrobiales bacterium]
MTVAHDLGDRAEALTVIRLEVVGHDRPGIVSQLAKAIAARGFNVESLESEVASAPMTGDLMFTARAALQAPAGSDLDDLRAELERLADELMVDVTLE